MRARTSQFDNSARLNSGYKKLIQLDDLNLTTVERVEPFAFISHETSPGNFQAWLAVAGADSEGLIFSRLKFGIGSDKGASGATKIAGFHNFKAKYAPNYPRVKVRHVAFGLTVTAQDLESAGMLAPEPEQKKAEPSMWTSEPNLPLPDYEEYLSGAPLTRQGKPDRSMADFAWSATALKRGYSIDQVEIELSRVSQKVADMPSRVRNRYVRRTVQKAAREVGV